MWKKGKSCYQSVGTTRCHVPTLPWPERRADCHALSLLGYFGSPVNVMMVFFRRDKAYGNELLWMLLRQTHPAHEQGGGFILKMIPKR